MHVCIDAKFYTEIYINTFFASYVKVRPVDNRCSAKCVNIMHVRLSVALIFMYKELMYNFGKLYITIDIHSLILNRFISTYDLHTLLVK